MKRRGVPPPLAAFLTIAFLITLFQVSNFIGATRVGIPIPDTVNMSRTIFFLKELQLLFSPKTAIFGVALLYGWTWYVSPMLCFVINALLMAAAVQLARDVFVEQLELPSWLSFSVLINPYLLFAMAGPNKEIPLLFLTMLFLRLLGTLTLSRVMLAVGVGVITILFRDGYGAFLSLWAVVLFVTRSPAFTTALTFAGCLAAATLQQLLIRFVPTFARNVSVADTISSTQLATGNVAASLGFSASNPIGAGALFLVRLVYNWLSAAINPILFTVQGTPYFLGWVYWLNGLVFVLAIPAAILSLLPGSKAPQTAKFMAAMVVSTWCLISVSLFVQPRYLMPVMPLAFGLFLQVSKPVRQMTLSSVTALVALVLLGNVIAGRFAVAGGERYERIDYYQRY